MVYVYVAALQPGGLSDSSEAEPICFEHTCVEAKDETEAYTRGLPKLQREKPWIVGVRMLNDYVVEMDSLITATQEIRQRQAPETAGRPFPTIATGAPPPHIR